MVKKESRCMISFEVSQRTAELWDAVRANPRAKRGFHTSVLRRLLENFLSDYEGWTDLPLDDDLKLRFERFHKTHEDKVRVKLQLETHHVLYRNAMQNAFDDTNIPILYVKHGIALLSDFISMVRSRVFEQSDYQYSIADDVVKEFIFEKLEQLEASGALNKLRCDEQMKDYGDNSSLKIEN